MNAPLHHPVPAAAEHQETAPAAPKPDPVYIDLDSLDQNKFQGAGQRSSFEAWRG